MLVVLSRHGLMRATSMSVRSCDPTARNGMNASAATSRAACLYSMEKLSAIPCDELLNRAPRLEDWIRLASPKNMSFCQPWMMLAVTTLVSLRTNLLIIPLTGAYFESWTVALLNSKKSAGAMETRSELRAVLQGQRPYQ
jgi:hypothetical protein